MLAIILASYTMIALDISIVITALPKIHTTLGFSNTALSWVQNAYLLAFGGLLLLGARAGDLLRSHDDPALAVLAAIASRQEEQRRARGDSAHGSRTGWPMRPTACSSRRGCARRDRRASSARRGRDARTRVPWGHLVKVLDSL